MPLLPDLGHYRRDWKHFISFPQLGGKYIGHVKIDGKYLLFKDPYSYDFFVLPTVRLEHPPFNKLVFYTNCLAYDHDAPTLLLPRYGRAPVEPLKGHGQKNSREQYCENQCIVLELLGSLKWGSLQSVRFRWSDLEQTVDLAYSTQYGPAAKELSLYSLALRQFDPLSEFLHYYRIMESVDGGNGKSWILNNVNRIKAFDFGWLELEDSAYFGNPKRRVNLFQRYRRKSQERLKRLRSPVSNPQVEEHFYRVRCGIAHGKTHVKHYDFSTTVASIWQDLYILKLLARIAIQDKMGPGHLVHKTAFHDY